MALLFYSDDDDFGEWREALSAHLPDLDMRNIDNLGNKNEIDMALVWKPPAGLLADLPNLQVIFSLAAGVDALLADDTLPKVPLCRMIDPSLTRGMSEFILFYVLRYYRNIDVYEAQQARAEWRLRLPPPPEELTIGILGLGELGIDAAGVLRRFGFTVHGWSRSAKSFDGVKSFHGRDQLGAFLSSTDIVVCLLPLTTETENLLDRAFFAAMRPGARFIHVGRGRQLVEDDLLAAVESGQIGSAVIDVTPIEPLDPASPLWRHPKVVVTPHAASYVQPKTGGANVAANILRFMRSEPLLGVVDRQRGY